MKATLLLLTVSILVFNFGIAYNSQQNTRFYRGNDYNYNYRVGNRFFTSKSLVQTPTKLLYHHVPVKSRCEEYAEFVDTNKRWGGRLGDIIRYQNIAIVGALFSIMLKVFNKFEAYQSEILFDVLWNKQNKRNDKNNIGQRKRGILTVANHKSFYYDPGIFSALLSWWRITPNQMRWTLCTEDVFFSHPFITSLLGTGNVVPLDRFGALDQSILRSFLNKLNDGKWCHIFVEGRVRQNWRFLSHEPKLGKIKVGVGKLIAHSHVCPVVIPMYHRGMDDVLPEIEFSDRKSIQPSKPISYIPTTGNHIEMYFGAPLDFSDKITAFKQQYPDALNQWRTSLETLQLYIDIASEIKKSLLVLEAEANQKDHTRDINRNSNNDVILSYQ